MHDQRQFLTFILRSWANLTIGELDRNGISPCPWNTAQAISQVAQLIAKLEGEQVAEQGFRGEGDGD